MANITATIEIGSLIVKTENICGNRPRIAGKRISVQQIVILTEEGLNPQQICEEYETLTLAEVHAALAYYYANKSEIDQYLFDEKAEYQELSSKYSA